MVQCGPSYMLKTSVAIFLGQNVELQGMMINLEYKTLAGIDAWIQTLPRRSFIPGPGGLIFVVFMSSALFLLNFHRPEPSHSCVD